MRPEDDIRLRHLREAASKAVRYSAAATRADLDDDELLRLALTKLVEIVGEPPSTSARSSVPSTRTCHGPLPLACATGSSTTTSTSTSTSCGRPSPTIYLNF
jgi:hypothetical protein